MLLLAVVRSVVMVPLVMFSIIGAVLGLSRAGSRAEYTSRQDESRQYLRQGFPSCVHRQIHPLPPLGVLVMQDKDAPARRVCPL